MFRLFLFIILLAFNARAEITYPEVETLIKDQNITTIEDFLKALPDSYKNQYTLLRASTALQEATLKNPRAVVYGETGELVMTFNSHPLDGGYNDVEFIAYDKVKKEFEMRVINFTDNQVTFSERNPAKCLNCHGQAPRPLWDNYPIWKNSFGSRNDILTRDEEAVLVSSLFREHDRFKHIIKKDADPLNPFKDAPATFGPNAMIGKYFTALQGEANAKRVFNSPGYTHSENLGLLAITACTFTPEVKRKLESLYLEKIEMLYPDQIGSIKWWTGKYIGESFYLTVLQSIYLFGMDYFNSNFFNLKMRYHEESLSTDSSQSVRDATLSNIGAYVQDPKLKQLILSFNRPALCTALTP